MNETYLCHHGVKGMKWGVRRYQNPDGTLTVEGKLRYNEDGSKKTKEQRKEYMQQLHDNSASKRKIEEESYNKMSETYNQMFDLYKKSGVRDQLIKDDAEYMYKNYREYTTLNETIDHVREWYDNDDGDPFYQGNYDHISKLMKNPEFDKLLKNYKKQKNIWNKALNENNQALLDYMAAKKYDDLRASNKSKKIVAAYSAIPLAVFAAGLYLNIKK